MISELFGGNTKLAVLIDPDHDEDPNLAILLDYLALGLADVILIGGSTSKHDSIDHIVQRIKASVPTPVVLFPGGALQISKYADALLLPSLISGRNPDYLIGEHVASARRLKDLEMDVIPMGYILVDGGKTSTTAQVTQTTPISNLSTDLVIDTAIAGELLGMQCIYLEAGSGAHHPADQQLIRKVKAQISIPLIVGGGIRTQDQLLAARSSGADMVVLGTVLEESPKALLSFHKAWTSEVVSN